MSDKLLFLNPVFQERIWGGRALETKFGYDIPAGKIGECWGISAHPNGLSTIKNGTYAGRTIAELWGHTPEIFGETTEPVFPLLVKVLDAADDLSVQVHPNDAYAQVNENGELGKTECWYVVDCEPGADIIIGHHAASKAEMAAMIKKGEWTSLLRKQPVSKGDFFYIPSGTIHAICAGTQILEVQQSSDTTYRLYDYDRRDDQGNLRELHIQKSIDVATVPHEPTNPEPVKTVDVAGLVVTELVANDFFSVSKMAVCGDALFTFAKASYGLISIVEGKGMIDHTPVKKGDHILVPVNAGELALSGSFEAIIAQP